MTPPPPPPPKEVRAVVDAFIPSARASGWDNMAGSEGKCWLIAHAFVRHARGAGLRAHFWQVVNPTATRLQDETSNFVVLDERWAVDFASRAGAGGDSKPWPRLDALEVYLADYGTRRPLCTECGTSGDLGLDGRLLPLSQHACPGLLSLPEHHARLGMQLAASLEYLWNGGHPAER